MLSVFFSVLLLLIYECVGNELTLVSDGSYLMTSSTALAYCF